MLYLQGRERYRTKKQEGEGRECHGCDGCRLKLELLLQQFQLFPEAKTFLKSHGVDVTIKLSSHQFNKHQLLI